MSSFLYVILKLPRENTRLQHWKFARTVVTSKLQAANWKVATTITTNVQLYPFSLSKKLAGICTYLPTYLPRYLGFDKYSILIQNPRSLDNSQS